MEPLIFNPPNEVITPDAISWFPPSWALIAVLCTTIGLTVWLVTLYRRYRKAFAAKRQALAELHIIMNESTVKEHDSGEQLIMINHLLKRVALHYYPQEKSQITILHGTQWSAWLCSKMKQLPTQDYPDSVTLLNHSIYQSATLLPNIITVPEAIEVVRAWCHKGLPAFNLMTMQLATPAIQTTTHKRLVQGVKHG